MLRKVHIRNYKNYRDAQAEFSGRFALINGDNGSGKTNLLDSIYNLCMCKSYFTRSDLSTVRRGESYYRLEGVFEEGDQLREIVCKYTTARQKEFSADGVPYARLSEHVGRFPVVIIAPNDIDLIYRTSDERRRFLDITLAQPDKDYLTALLEYNRVLQQRNALLKQYQHTADAFSILDVFDRQLSKSGAIIHQKRSDFIAAFESPFYTVYNRICGQSETPVITYQSSLHEADFAALLHTHRHRDIEAMRSTVGIHKDDLEFVLNDLPVKESASQGQVKSVLLALKLAQSLYLAKQTGKQPVLLLDDVFEKLDLHRLAALFQLLKGEEFGQVLITDTDAERSRRILTELEIECDHFTVSNGQIA